MRVFIKECRFGWPIFATLAGSTRWHDMQITFHIDLCVVASQQLLPLAQRPAAALRAAGYGEQGITFLINDGPTSNQHVPHLHLHLILRRSGDVAHLLWRALTRFLPLGRKRIEARLQQEAQQLREALSNV